MWRSRRRMPRPSRSSEHYCMTVGKRRCRRCESAMAVQYATVLAGMRFLSALTIGLTIGAVSLCVQAQTPPGKEATETKGLPPRAAPSDYQAQGKAGTVTIGAEFTGHAIPTPEGPLSSEDYV